MKSGSMKHPSGGGMAKSGGMKQMHPKCPKMTVDEHDRTGASATKQGIGKAMFPKGRKSK